MRPLILLLLASVAAGPAFAQQASPMTGTTSTAPVAPPAVAPPAVASPGVASPGAPLPPAPRISHPRATMQQRFDAANTTRDGKLTLDQAKAANLVRIVNNYDAIDATRKGYVTMEDLRAFNRAQRQARRAAAAKPAQ